MTCDRPFLATVEAMTSTVTSSYRLRELDQHRVPAQKSKGALTLDHIDKGIDASSY